MLRALLHCLSMVENIYLYQTEDIHNVGKRAVQSDLQSVFDMSTSMLEALEAPYQSWLN